MLQKDTDNIHSVHVRIQSKCWLMPAQMDRIHSRMKPNEIRTVCTLQWNAREKKKRTRKKNRRSKNKANSLMASTLKWAELVVWEKWVNVQTLTFFCFFVFRILLIIECDTFKSNRCFFLSFTSILLTVITFIGWHLFQPWANFQRQTQWVFFFSTPSVHTIQRHRDSVCPSTCVREPYLFWVIAYFWFIQLVHIR